MIRIAAALLAALLPALAAQGSEYALDPTHTAVTFEAAHFGTSTSRGRFERIVGNVRLDRAARTGRVEIEIATASISTGVPVLDGRLRGADFLDTETHPTARFVAERLVFEDAAANPKVVEVPGELTLLGRTLPLTLRATSFGCYLSPLLLREVCGGDFEATLERSRWGMDRAMNVAPDTIRLLVQVEAIRQ
jgi:polyisoprenoid-binding protein YceI